MGTTATGEQIIESTGREVQSGLKWVSAGLGLARVAQIVTTMVLADVLSRSDFGLVGMAMLIIHLMGVVREMGFSQAYIYLRTQGKDDRRTVNTVFLLSSAVGIALFCASYAGAPAISGFFKDSEGLTPVLRWMLLGFLIHPLTTTPSSVLQKEMRFRETSLGEVASGFTYAGVGIGLALSGFGVWSLVIGYVTSRLVAAVVLMRAAGWRPTLDFDRTVAATMFKYGKYLWGLSVVSTLGWGLDRILIKRSFEGDLFGVYQLAFALCIGPAFQASFIINRVTFPALSRFQGDLAAQRRGFVKMLSHVSLVAMPVALGLIAVSDIFVQSLWADKWLDAVPVINVMALFGLTLSLGAITTPTFKAIGKPNVLMYTSLLHFALLAIGLWIAWQKADLVWYAWCVLVPLVIGSAIAVVLVEIYMELPVRKVLEPFLRSGLAGICMFGAVGLFKAQVVGSLDVRVALGVCVAFGMLVYSGASLVFNREAFLGVWNTISKSVSRRRA